MTVRANGDAGGDTRRQVQRLYEQADDRRFATEAIHLALEAYSRFDPAVHRLTRTPKDFRASNQIGYCDYFRLVAFDRFRCTRNVGLAGKLLDLLIAEARL